MSNVPMLLRQHAEGLRKEAQENARAAETAYYAALELVKAASADTDYLDRAHQAAMLDAAQRQAYAMERHGVDSAISSRLTRLSTDDVEELKRKIAAMEGYDSARLSARKEAPVNSGLRAGVGALIGGGLGVALGGHLGAGLVPGLIGAAAGGISGMAAKDTYARNNYDRPQHLAIGEAVRDVELGRLGKTDIERQVHNWGHENNSQYGLEHEYENTPGHRTFYKQAGFSAIQELCSQGVIDQDVAAAALFELNRRLDQ